MPRRPPLGKHTKSPQSFASYCYFMFRKPPAWHRVLPGPSGPEPQKSPKRVRKGVPGPPAGEPQSPQRVRPGVRKESTNTASDSFLTLFGLPGALFGDSGAPRGRRPRETLRTLSKLGFRAQRAREDSVPGRGVPNFMCCETPGQLQGAQTPKPKISQTKTQKNYPLARLFHLEDRNLLKLRRLDSLFSIFPKR